MLESPYQGKLVFILRQGPVFYLPSCVHNKTLNVDIRRKCKNYVLREPCSTAWIARRNLSKVHSRDQIRMSTEISETIFSTNSAITSFWDAVSVKEKMADFHISNTHGYAFDDVWQLIYILLKRLSTYQFYVVWLNCCFCRDDDMFPFTVPWDVFVIIAIMLCNVSSETMVFMPMGSVHVSTSHS